MSAAVSGEHAAELVLLAASLVPPGRVVSYGDVAELVGTSARRVGAIMRDQGSAVPFWRVISASGRLTCLSDARPHWAAEGIRIRADGEGCRITEFRAELGPWAAAFEEARDAVDRGFLTGEKGERP